MFVDLRNESILKGVRFYSTYLWSWFRKPGKRDIKERWLSVTHTLREHSIIGDTSRKTRWHVSGDNISRGGGGRDRDRDRQWHYKQGRGRKREKETETERDREGTTTEIQRENRDRQRDTERETDRETDRHTHTQTETDRQRERETETERERERKTPILSSFSTFYLLCSWLFLLCYLDLASRSQAYQVSWFSGLLIWSFQRF